MNEIIKRENRLGILLGCFFVGTSVILGAFGAHGLKNILNELQLTTYKTGVHYQMIHGIGFFAILSAKNFLRPEVSYKNVMYTFSLGIILFSFNCYIYAVTSIKTFAMIVPLGGLAFIVGWVMLAYKALRS